MGSQERGNGRPPTGLASIDDVSSRPLSGILDHVAEGCAVVGFDGTCLFVNEAAARHGGRERVGLMGRTDQETCPGIEESPACTA